MKLSTSLALAVLLASAPAARAQGTAQGGAAKKADEAKAGDAAKKAKPRKGAKAQEQDATGPSPAARAHARRIKSVFLYATESCARAPDRCDAALLADSEVRFLEACGACNTSQRCEAERDAIRAGTTKASKDPCAP